MAVFREVHTGPTELTSMTSKSWATPVRAEEKVQSLSTLNPGDPWDADMGDELLCAMEAVNIRLQKPLMETRGRPRTAPVAVSPPSSVPRPSSIRRSPPLRLTPWRDELECPSDSVRSMRSIFAPDFGENVYAVDVVSFPVLGHVPALCGRGLSDLSRDQEIQGLGQKSRENGFVVMDERALISIRPEKVALFSVPEEALTFEPVAGEYLEGGLWQRLIACNTELTSLEVGQLECLRAEASAHNVEFLPSIVASAPRYLCECAGNVAMALMQMRLAQEWRLSFQPVSDTSVEEDLRDGVAYFAGRDKSLRPALILRPGRKPGLLEHSPRLTRLLVFCVEYFTMFMRVPGRVENIVVILNMANLTTLPQGCVPQLQSALGRQPPGLVHRFYVCSMLPAMQASAAGLLAKITHTQRKKVCFVSPAELADLFAAHELEQDLGGARPTLTEFFPFPLLPGPYSTRSGLHELFTPASRRGRLWDPRRSRLENTQLGDMAGLDHDEQAQWYGEFPFDSSALQLDEAYDRTAGNVRVQESGVRTKKLFDCWECREEWSCTSGVTITEL